jgi:ketosteroid isomerase-like protein
MDTDVVHQDELKAFLKRYGEALVTGDLTAIAACYAVPCLFLSDATSAAIAARSEIRELFKGAAGQYRAQGLVVAHPNILRSEAVTKTLVWAEVSWDYRDDHGNSAQPEIYRYVLRLNADTGPQIQVVIVMPDL